MSPEDAQDIYDDLRRLLAQFGFSWIVENVDAKLQDGVHEDVTLPRYRESLNAVEAPREPRGGRERVTGRRGHTEPEKLTLLLDEIERCVIVPIRIANEIPRTLSTSEEPLDSIELINDETGETEFRIDAITSVGSEHVEDLKAVLRHIRES